MIYIVFLKGVKSLKDILKSLVHVLGDIALIFATKST